MKKLTATLSKLHKALVSTGLHDVVKEQFFNQLFYLINCVVLNAMTEKGSNYCTASGAFNIKLAISPLEQWGVSNLRTTVDKVRYVLDFVLSELRDFLQSNTENSDTLRHVTEATNLLVMDKVPAIVSEDIRSEVRHSFTFSFK